MKITLSTPIASTYVGVFKRGDATHPDRDHYAAFVDPSGIIKLRRRNNYSYSSLVTGPAFPSGTHVIGVSTAGTNPVQITVTLDGETVIEYSDSSSSRLNGTKVGIFDYNGAGQPIDDFVVAKGPQASDNFDTGTTLGAQWTVPAGSFSVSSSRAHSTAAESFALTGPLTLDTTAAVELDYAWLMQTFSGVVLRAGNGTDSLYAGGVDASGNLVIARRNADVFSTLVTGDPFPSGVHVLSLTATGTDPVQLSLKIDGVEWLRFDDASSGRISWEGQAGIFSSEPIYSSGQYFGRFDLFAVVDGLSVVPPILRTIPAQTVVAGETLIVPLRGTDKNGGELTFSSPNLPAGATIDTIRIRVPFFGGLRVWNIGIFTWTPTEAQVGSHAPTITVTDDTSLTDSHALEITVTGPCSGVMPHFLNASPAPVPVKTFYVNGANGSNSNDGSEAAPFQTIDYAMDHVQTTFCGGARCTSGVRILIESRDRNAPFSEIQYKEKIYQENLWGSETAPIWIGGEPEAEPTLVDDYDPLDSNDRNEVMQLIRPQYVVLENMKIGVEGQETRTHGISIEDGGEHDSFVAHHVIIRNLTFTNIGDGVPRGDPGEEDAIANCLKLSGLNDFYILDSTFRFCGRHVIGVDDTGGAGVDCVGCHDGVIAGNTHEGRKFVQAKGGSRNIEIRQNDSTHLLRDDEERAISYNLGGNTGPQYFRPSLDCETDPTCPGEVSDPELLHYEGRHIRLISNILREGGDYAGSGAGIRLEGCYQCLIANNTIINPKVRFIHVTQGGLSRTAIEQVGGGRGMLVAEGRVYNNIFHFDDGGMRKVAIDFEDGIDDDASDIPEENWKSFEFFTNLSCNRDDPVDCAPKSRDLDDGPTGEIPVNVDWRESTGHDPQFASSEDDYMLDSSSTAKHSGTSLTAGPSSPLSVTGSSATAVPDFKGVCFADAPSNPSRGARETP